MEHHALRDEPSHGLGDLRRPTTAPSEIMLSAKKYAPNAARESMQDKKLFVTIPISAPPIFTPKAHLLSQKQTLLQARTTRITRFEST
jgi:hypothetical protein